MISLAPESGDYGALTPTIHSIKKKAGEIKRKVRLMEVCGGHTNLVLKCGLRGVLPENIVLFSGPGCPVCVSSQHDLDCVIELAENGIPIATYGDMMRVPGTRKSLEEAKQRGAEVFEVYSADEVLGLRKTHPEIVFFGVGFETTAPMSAFLLEKGVCVYSSHKLVPPAMQAIAEGRSRIDGFINPGHVSAIIGVEAYGGIRLPQAIAGFTPASVLRAIDSLLELVASGKSSVVNCYPEVVRTRGNPKARRMLAKRFRVVDSAWRGLGLIPGSGLEVMDTRLNAKHRHHAIIGKVRTVTNRLCRCGDVLCGNIIPTQCRLFGNACTPSSPVGACMVSAEGGCSIYYRYKISSTAHVK